MDTFIPKPILLNCWKHHAGYIKNRIDSYSNKNFHELITEISVIGNSLMDLYLGEISPAEIVENIIYHLKEGSVESKTQFLNWLHKEEKDYRNLILPDESTWTLRLGNEAEKFIHIHPARYSAYTIRVRSISLKTAIAVNVWIKIYGGELLDLKIINKIRREYLKESPVKEIKSEEGLGKLILLLNEKCLLY